MFMSEFCFLLESHHDNYIPNLRTFCMFSGESCWQREIQQSVWGRYEETRQAGKWLPTSSQIRQDRGKSSNGEDKV